MSPKRAIILLFWLCKFSDLKDFFAMMFGLNMNDSDYLAAQIISIYRRYAKAWTDLRGQWLYEKTWLDRFLGLLPAQAKILDLGCGSGRPIAAYLLQHGHQLTGVDSADSMLEMARCQRQFKTDPFYLKTAK